MLTFGIIMAWITSKMFPLVEFPESNSPEQQ